MTPRRPADRGAGRQADAARHGPPPRRRRSTGCRSTQQVGKLIVLRFDGTAVPSYVRRVLHDGEASGAILFRANIVDPTQLKGLTARCAVGRARRARRRSSAPTRRAARSATCRGRRRSPHRRRSGRARTPPPPRGRCGSPASTSRSRRSPTRPASRLGDGSRAFSGDIAASTAAAVKGWLAGGVRPTVKHFPGLGATTVNTDKGSATIAGGAPTARDLAPFKAAIAAGAPIVMTSHAVYPARDRANIASPVARRRRPICCAASCTSRGVVMTDSIEAAAVRDTGSTETAAVRSIRGGQRHRADHRRGLVDPHLPRAAGGGARLEARSAHGCERPPPACSHCKSRSTRTFVDA